MEYNHSAQWQSIQTAILNKRLPQALFFIGPLHYRISKFAVQIAQFLHCKMINEAKACEHCSDCQMVQRMEHPDLRWVKPEKNGSAIKVEQIRELQHLAFLSSQRSHYKIIVIECADKLNRAASNALLKMLEEPSEQTHFILLAEQISTVLPTILSRCQKIHFSSANDNSLENLLQLADYYAEDSERAVLVKQADSLITELIALIEKKQDPCILASQWNKFELNNLLWFLYLIYSQVHYLYINKIPAHSPAYNSLMKLKTVLNPWVIFDQIDKINNILKKLSHNININQLLALEDLLFSLSHPQ